jgi:hypothetical protein
MRYCLIAIAMFSLVWGVVEWVKDHNASFLLGTLSLLIFGAAIEWQEKRMKARDGNPRYGITRIHGTDYDFGKLAEGLAAAHKSEAEEWGEMRARPR